MPLYCHIRVRNGNTWYSYDTIKHHQSYVYILYVYRIYMFHDYDMLHILNVQMRWFTKGTYIYIDVTLLLELEFYTLYLTTYTEPWQYPRRKLLGSDPRRVHGWRFCVLSPTGWGIHSLVWRVGERIFERDQWWLDLRFLFFCTGVLLDCVCVWKFPVKFLFGHHTNHHSGVFFVIFNIEMDNLFLPNISYGSRF